MQTGAVEADGLGPLDVGLQFPVSGRRPDPLGVEPLIEDETQEDGLAIEEKSISLDVELPQTCVAVHDVDDVAVRVDQFEAQSVQVRIGR